MHKTSKKAVQNQLFKKLFCYSFFIQFMNNEEYLFHYEYRKYVL